MLYGIVHSSQLDMNVYLKCFEDYADEVTVVTEDMPHDPSKITFALLWHPNIDFFERYPNVRLVASIAAGVDNIFACQSIDARVQVCRNRDPEQASIMSTFALWHIINHQRNFPLYLQQQRESRWQSLPMRAPSEVNIGVLGLGFLGEHIANDCQRLGFSVAGWRKHKKDIKNPNVPVYHGANQLSAFLCRTEVLICVLPLTEETRGILNRALFEQLKPNAYLIHIGRGGQLDAKDLLEALDEGFLCGASVDVFEEEPLPQTSPFWKHPNIIVTPHDASDVRPVAAVFNLIEEVRRFSAGIPLMNSIQSNIGY
ncbi:2-hydroxyacid dehydrogenase [Neptunomonas antarctica]|uniref:Glyoxylate/hydroxypyruvate reductase A n=1 Tax=Neptunomonas antarctica TaxID=619304 RepID=A0A1N7P2G5_9GAMM|nr:glyoxylate/hydroxypyruvate reductase A [Neptunomonas antarctica]SIT04758.1 glyoxylate/hydroxypyruvate reductase A [Neptunomonas antarctica]